MPLIKLSEQTLIEAGESHVVLSSKTIKLIENPDALAILIYQLDQSGEGHVSRRNVMRRFSIGRARYDKATAHLRDLGLYFGPIVRGKAGPAFARTLRNPPLAPSMGLD